MTNLSGGTVPHIGGRLTCAVALATFNGAAFLEEQLRSISTQTRRPDQLVVSDDASTDDTLAIVHRVSPSITADCTILAETQRVGAVLNFQRAFSRVNADIVLLCDQDDVWDPEKVSIVMSRFEQDPDVGGVFSDGAVLLSGRSRRPRSLWRMAGFSPQEQCLWESDPLGILLRHNVVTGATLAVRTELLRRFLPLPPTGWHDLSIAVHLVVASQLRPVASPLVSYRLHHGNATGLPGRSLRSRIVGPDSHVQNLDSQLSHWSELRTRLESMGADSTTLSRIDGKISHLEARRALPSRRRSRARAAVREARRGGYRTYANGPWILMRDLFGP